MTSNEFIKNIIKKNKLPIFLWVVMEMIMDFFVIFVAQYFNKKAIMYFQAEDSKLLFGLILIFTYIFVNNLQPIFEVLFGLKLKNVFLAKLTKKIREENFEKTTKHSLRYFNGSFSGDISSKITNISNNSSLLIEHIVKIFIGFFILFLTTFFYYEINPYLALSFFVSCAIFLILPYKAQKDLIVSDKEKAKASSEYMGAIVDVFGNIRNLKSFSNSRLEKLNSKKKNLNIQRKEKNLADFKLRLQLLYFISIFFMMFSITLIASYLLMIGKINYGDFVYVTIIMLINRFVINQIMRSIINFQYHNGALSDAVNKIYQDIEIEDTSDKELKVKNGKITFKNIRFSYEKQ